MPLLKRKSCSDSPMTCFDIRRRWSARNVTRPAKLRKSKSVKRKRPIAVIWRNNVATRSQMRRLRLSRDAKRRSLARKPETKREKKRSECVSRRRSAGRMPRILSDAKRGMTLLTRVFPSKNATDVALRVSLTSLNASTILMKKSAVA